MNDSSQLTELEVIEFAHKWYYMLNTHASFEEFLPLLNKDDLVMRFPEETMKGVDAFKEWHKTVTNKFFDQDHNIKYLDVKIDGNRADVKVIVRWQAKTWEPPAAKSSWLGYDAYQSWIIIKDADSGKPVIKYYSVDAFMPMENSN